MSEFECDACNDMGQVTYIDGVGISLPCPVCGLYGEPLSPEEIEALVDCHECNEEVE